MAIQLGSRGDEVKELQKAINDAGYTPPLVVDGVFGPKTQTGNKWLFDKNQADGTAPQDGVATDTGEPDRYADGDARFVGLGGNPEIWHNSTTGEDYIVYFVPGTEPPIPTYWRVDKEEHLKAYFGGAEVKYDRVMSSADMKSSGSLYQGLNTELVDRDGDPMIAITERIKLDMEVRPYLKDPQVAAVIMAAALEGVAPLRADFEKTDWWIGKTDGERGWLLKSASDPKTAQTALEANRISVRQKLESAGVFSPPDNLVNFMADQNTKGLWDATKLTNQINIVSDPSYNGVLDAGVDEIISGIDGGIDTNTDELKWVRDEAIKQLGPVHGTLTEAQASDVAGRIRNDPNYRDEWLTNLQGQRLAMYPAYTDPTTSYDELAQPWRSVYFQTMGEEADEASSQFQDMLQRNDLATSKAALRQFGLTDGNQKVTNEAFGALANAMGSGVRRVV